MPRRLALCCLIVAVAVPCPRAAVAQAVVTGRVTGADRAIANAEVSAGGAVRALTTDSGAYRLDVPSPGATAQLSVRAVGFKPSSRTVTLSANDTVVVDFVLEAIPQVLDSINVEARPAYVIARMRGFEERRAGTTGYFFTRQDLAKHEHSILSNTLRRSSVRLMQRPTECGGGYAVATGRGGSSVTQVYTCGRSRFPPGCYAIVFLDGILYWGPGLGPPPDIDLIKVADLEGVEAYRSALEAPLQFQSLRSPCGMVLLWTRIGGDVRR